MKKEEYDMEMKIIMHKVDELHNLAYNRVTREEFEPVKKIVLGLAFTTLTFVILLMIISILPRDTWHTIVRFFQ